MSVADLIHLIVKETNYKEYLENQKSQDHEQRWENVQELVRCAIHTVLTPRLATA